MNPAQHSRLEKEAHPELYCSVKACLWKIVKRDGTLDPCRKHPKASP